MDRPEFIDLTHRFVRTATLPKLGVNDDRSSVVQRSQYDDIRRSSNTVLSDTDLKRRADALGAVDFQDVRY
jgi:hypothetical protein